MKQLFDLEDSGHSVPMLRRLGVNICAVDSVTGIETGAYSEKLNTVFLNNSFILGNTVDHVAEILTEEIGHALDSIINNYKDSPGDEGELFSAFVFGIRPESLPVSAYN